jgi:tRNA (guanine-N7-)-methyltransferase
MAAVAEGPVSPIEFIPISYFEPLRLAELFPQESPLEVDLGCGEGAFILEMARRNPSRSFLGIERLFGRVRNTCRKGERLALNNLRVLRVESLYAVKYLLPAQSVTVFHVSFPDPWPKHRHHPRRLVKADFMESVHAALIPGGELRLTTDHAGYFAQMNEVAVGCAGLFIENWTPPEDYPQTDFERHFRAKGEPIYRLLLRKI